MFGQTAFQTAFQSTVHPLACRSTSAEIVRQARAGAFRDQRRFALMPVEVDALRVSGRSETAYLAPRSPEQREAWEEVKLAVIDSFIQHLTAHAKSRNLEVFFPTATPAKFYVRPRIRFIEPGIYDSVIWRRSELRMSIQVVTATGKVLDEITLEHKTLPSTSKHSVRERLVFDAAALGEAFAEHLVRLVQED